MKVLVTGADGMLGSHICRELIRQGYSVKALIQKERSTGTLEGLDIDEMYGDILDYDILIKGLSDCDAVIHTAASTAIWPSRSQTIWKLNYEAVKNLAKAVLSMGTDRFIHIGTANSFSPGSKDYPGTEQNGYSDYKYKLDYQDSKYAAQRYLLGLYKTEGLPVRIINPTFMFGAYDSKPGSGQMISSIYNHNVPGYTSGGKSYIAAKDVAVGIVNTLQKGRNGECYIAAGKNLNYKEAFNLIATIVGVDPPSRFIPSVFVDIFGLFGSLFGRFFKIEPKISFPMARLSHEDCYYSNEKAVRELNLPQTPIEEAIQECFIWLRNNGHLS